MKEEVHSHPPLSLHLSEITTDPGGVTRFLCCVLSMAEITVTTFYYRRRFFLLLERRRPDLRNEKRVKESNQ